MNLHELFTGNLPVEADMEAVPQISSLLDPDLDTEILQSTDSTQDSPPPLPPISI